MSELFGHIKDYLPKFLSPERQAELYKELDRFPENIDQRIYSRCLSVDGELYQGDGIAELPVVNLPAMELKPASCLVISNSCDIAPQNKRNMTPRLCYCPIIKMANLKALVEKTLPLPSANDFIGNVRKQHVNAMIYLPKGCGLEEESVALLDNCLNLAFPEETYKASVKKKLFTLSNYGFYLFLFKLSVHFTRITDGKDRDAVVV